MKRGWKCLAPIAFTLVGVLVAVLAWGETPTAPPSNQHLRFPERIDWQADSRGEARTRADADSVVGPSESDDDYGCIPRCDHCWSVTAEALLLSRVGRSSYPLVSRTSDNAVLLDASDLHSPFAAGPRIAITRSLANDYDLEAVYFGIDGWRAAAAEGDPSGVRFDAPSLHVAMIGGGRFEFTSASELHNVEINLRKTTERCWNLLVGFRWLELTDSLNGSFEGIPISPRSFWDSSTNNQLYGAQLGSEIILWNCGERVRLDAATKAGLFGNHATQASASPIAGLTGSASQNHAAFVGEVGLNAAWQVTQHSAFRLGYEVLWLESVAVAADQIVTSDLPNNHVGVNTDGGLFYHGAHIGLDVAF